MAIAINYTLLLWCLARSSHPIPSRFPQRRDGARANRLGMQEQVPKNQAMACTGLYRISPRQKSATSSSRFVNPHSLSNHTRTFAIRGPHSRVWLPSMIAERGS